MHALSSSISTKTPARPRSPTTLVAKLASGSVMEARTSTAPRQRRRATASPPGRPSVGFAAPWPIPLFDTATPLAPLRARARRARSRAVLDSGRYILGPEVEAFEREFAAYLGVRHVVGVANGTDALTIALRALGVGPGDEVVVPVVHVLRDAPRRSRRPARGRSSATSTRDTFCVTAETVRAALTPRTRAVVAVDLFGNAGADRRDRGARRAGARGRRAGGRRDARRAAAPARSATPRRSSFFPSKNLGCFGDGGAIATDDDDARRRARACCASTARATSSTLRAGRLQLAPRRAAGGGAARAAAAARRLVRRPPRGRARATPRPASASSSRCPRPTAGAEPAWHLYVVRHPTRRRAGRRAHARRGIGARAYYRTPAPPPAGDARRVRRRRRAARHRRGSPARTSRCR